MTYHPRAGIIPLYLVKKKKIKKDRLFSCVAEFYRNPDSLLKSRGSKYITLHHQEGKNSVYTKIVTLPSGREIYVGNLAGKTIISDGELYHLSQSSINHHGLGSSLWLAWADLTTSYCLPTPPLKSSEPKTARHGHGHRPTPEASTPLQAKIPLTVRSWLPFFTAWKTILAHPVDNLLKAFTLPGATAQEVQTRIDDAFEEDWPNDIKDLINDEITPATSGSGCHPSPGEANDENYFLVHKSLNVIIDGKDTTLSMPHHEAQSELEHLLSVFQHSIGADSNSIEKLLSFDKFIGEKNSRCF
ncbi:hypothetical protein ABK905_11085 [Acerihabitans sp. KWT182]|uniref:Uncharacterized protein n=1 Tax=Acerihabitans sp. KWT182 TaxID=3157919 RepID=A0AAU7QE15_9GAMM